MKNGFFKVNFNAFLKIWAASSLLEERNNREGVQAMTNKLQAKRKNIFLDFNKGTTLST